MNRPTATFNEVPECVSQTLEEVRELKKFLLAYLSTLASKQGVEVDELLTPDETAQVLKVSKVTVWDWEKRGILTARRIGNQVRYLRSEVMAAARPAKGGRKVAS